ncbi:MAG: hypothetical protein WBF53_06415 [Litorimonas sp.]
MTRRSKRKARRTARAAKGCFDQRVPTTPDPFRALDVAGVQDRQGSR